MSPPCEPWWPPHLQLQRIFLLGPFTSRALWLTYKELVASLCILGHSQCIIWLGIDHFWDETGHPDPLTSGVPIVRNSVSPLQEHVLISQSLFGNGECRGIVLNNTRNKISSLASFNTRFSTGYHHLPFLPKYLFSLTATWPSVTIPEDSLTFSASTAGAGCAVTY